MMDLSTLPSVFTDRRKDSVARLIEGFVDPRLTAVRLGRALRDEGAQKWADTTLFEGDAVLPFLRSLCLVLSQSEFLTSILERDPDLLISFRSDQDFSRSTSPQIFRDELHRHLNELRPGDSFQKGLARFKLHEIFRIAVRDITNRATIETLARELSDVADLILEAAYEKAYSEGIKSWGVPLLEDGRAAEMTILSMGKHGSRELNFSSDLDLIFAYEGTGETDLEMRRVAYRHWLENHPFSGYLAGEEIRARTRPVDFERFFTELGTQIIVMLSEVGEYGSIYRIDMRLRPDGATGPLTRNLKSTLEYYESFGEKWERQALLRVRPTAGHPALGEVFMEGIRPFIYRKYVDDVEVKETLAEMRNLRVRSISKAGTDISEIARNIKNGPGGIRDIEFMVQAVQVLYGGQYPEFRDGTLFEILRRIHQSGLLGENDFRLLSEGYDLQRRVEHRIQMDDLQRYHVPLPGPSLEALATSLGYSGGAEFEKHLFEKMRGIHALFQGVFSGEEEEDEAGRILDLGDLSSYWNSRLKGIGIRQPDVFFKSLKRLAEDRDAPHLNSKLKRLLKRLLPRLLKILNETPNPTEAWSTFERISTSTSARSTLFSLLCEDTNTLNTLLNLGAAGPSLADRVVTYPQLLNDLRELANQQASERVEDMAMVFQDSEDRSIAGKLPRLRRFRTRMEVDIAGGFATGKRTIDDAVRLNSELAAFCLKSAFAEIFGQGEDVLILALGKFAGRELGFKSDLDCVLIRPNGPKEADESSHRLTSQLVREMNTTTTEGYLYELDLRLRPYGKDGSLVPTLDKATEYYRTSGQTWERLAWSRCRILSGSEEIQREFRESILEWVFGAKFNSDTAGEIHAMRLRIEREKPRQVLKAGPGGLLDVEFIAQAGSLKWGKKYEFDASNTSRALLKMSEKGLLPNSAVESLVEGYAFLRDLENRLLLLGREGANGIPEDSEMLLWLLGCLNRYGNPPPPNGPWNERTLREAEAGIRSRNREIFETFFATVFPMD